MFKLKSRAVLVRLLRIAFKKGYAAGFGDARLTSVGPYVPGVGFVSAGSKSEYDPVGSAARSNVSNLYDARSAKGGRAVLTGEERQDAPRSAGPGSAPAPTTSPLKRNGIST